VLAPRGRLIYATCSSEPEENEHVVHAFLEMHPEFALVDLGKEVSATLQPLLDAQGQLRTLPFAHGLEAFFAAVMLRCP
jgi:16S rRNA (cytosine967-C5)-methyltransferase